MSEKRDYKSILYYLLRHGKAPLLVPIIQIGQNHEGNKRMEKYIEYIDGLIETGKIKLINLKGEV